MRQFALKIVQETMENGRHSDDIFHEIILNNPGLSRQEKNRIRRLSYGTIERAIELDEYMNCVSKTPVKKMDSMIRSILRLGCYELFFMDSIPASATCNEMVELAKNNGMQGRTGFVNAVLRNIARAGYDKLKDEILQKKRDPVSRLSFEYSMPYDLADMIVQAYGKKTAKKIFASFYEEHPVTIRVHTMNASARQVREELSQVGVDVKECVYPDNAFEIRGFEQIDQMPGYAEGHYTVQDKSSMIPALVADIKHGDTVLDVCSSPGGKAFHALDLLKGDGMLCARDLTQKKMEKIQENAKRLHADNVELKVWDAAVPDPTWKEKADIVLADVPCSGIGVIGKKPEIKYEAMCHAKDLADIQKKIVSGVYDSLKNGGVMVYSTCTVNPAENEENVRWITEHFPLKLVSLDDCLPELLCNKMTKEGMLQILPGIHDGDGFFVAKFIKEVSERRNNG